jgi:hypothetical protein
VAFQKGKKKTGGRKPGQPNHATVQGREAYRFAFEKIGGAEELAKWAMNKENRLEFYKLHARTIPAEPVKTDGVDEEYKMVAAYVASQMEKLI